MAPPAIVERYCWICLQKTQMVMKLGPNGRLLYTVSEMRAHYRIATAKGDIEGFFFRVRKVQAHPSDPSVCISLPSVKALAISCLLSSKIRRID
jgi:hypothetical protein